MPRKKASTEQQTTPTTLDINDLVVVRQVIDAATKGGIFTASNLTVVGGVYDKVNTVVESFLKAQEEAKAEATPNGDTTSSS